MSDQPSDQASPQPSDQVLPTPVEPAPGAPAQPPISADGPQESASASAPQGEPSGAQPTSAFGTPPPASPYGTPPQNPQYGTPPNAPAGTPPQGPQYGQTAPYGSAPQGPASYGAAPQGYQAPPPGYGAPSQGQPSGYGAPGQASGYGAPGQAPGYGAPQGQASGYGVPSQAYGPQGQTGPGYGSSQPPQGPPQPPQGAAPYGQQAPAWSAYGAQQPTQHLPPAHQAPGQPPYGQPGYPPPGAPGGPMAPQPWGASGRPPAGKKPPTLLLIIGGAVLLLIVGLVFATLQLTSRGTPLPFTPTTTNTPGGGLVGTPQQVVEQYFAAITNNDPAGVAAVVDSVGFEDAFVTSEVMSAAGQAAPLGDLTVKELSKGGSSARVQATYSVGGSRTIETFNLFETQGKWVISNPLSRVFLGSLDPTGSGLTLNGVPVDRDTVLLLPGGYKLATDGGPFAFSPATFVVKDSQTVNTAGIRLKLSSAGLSDFRSAVKSLVNSCKKPGGLVVPKCGINFRKPSGYTVRGSSVSCTPSGTSSINSVVPLVISPDNVRASLKVKYKCRMRATNGTPFTGDDDLRVVTARYTGSRWTFSGY